MENNEYKMVDEDMTIEEKIDKIENKLKELQIIVNDIHMMLICICEQKNIVFK